jgi:hypothetical protein
VTLAESEPTALNSTDAAIASANGSGTLLDPKHIRISRPGPDASVSTLLGPEQHPPAWVEQLVLEEIPANDDYGLIWLETLVRFAQVCSALPEQTPKPYCGVGDDATISAEWDLGRYHIGIQVGNDPTVDSIILEVDREEPEESSNVGILPALMLSILPD